MTDNTAEKSKTKYIVYDGRSFQTLPAQFFTLFLKSSEHHGTFASMGAWEELFPGSGHRAVHQLFGTIGEEKWTALFDQDRATDTRVVVMRPFTLPDLAEWEELKIFRQSKPEPVAA